MPLEAIACTNCGSTDVAEYKAGSYVCGHCDTAFKHIDTSRVTVQREFCECGKVSQARCVACHKDLCATHAGRVSGLSLGFSSVVPSTVPAYRLDHSEHDSRGSQGWPSEGFVALAPEGVVRSVVATELDAYPGVYCDGCAQLAIASAVEDIKKALAGAGDRDAAQAANGELCAAFTCGVPTSSVCSCCRLRYCDSHSSTSSTVVVLSGGHHIREKMFYRESGQYAVEEVSRPAAPGSPRQVEFDTGAHCNSCREDFLGALVDTLDELAVARFAHPNPYSARRERHKQVRAAGALYDEILRRVGDLQAAGCARRTADGVSLGQGVVAVW